MEQPFDGKKLFIVEFEYRIVMLAKDQQTARLKASLLDDLNFDNADITAWESASLPDGWDTAVPYGHKGKETCEEIVGIMEEYERTRPRTRAELEAAGQVPLIPENTEAKAGDGC